MLFALGITPAPAAEAPVLAAVHALIGALRPWAAPHDYPNFRESTDAPTRFYPQPVLDRLLAIQRRHDPQRVVRANHEWAA